MGSDSNCWQRDNRLLCSGLIYIYHRLITMEKFNSYIFIVRTQSRGKTLIQLNFHSLPLSIIQLSVREALFYFFLFNSHSTFLLFSFELSHDFSTFLAKLSHKTLLIESAICQRPPGRYFYEFFSRIKD